MKRYLINLLMTISLVIAWTGSYATDPVLHTGGFPDVSWLSKFVRGISTEAEVLEKLGTPSGRGGALFAPDYRKREILYYENIELTNYRSTTDPATGSGYIQINMKQEILGVLILNGRFDGFLWYTNSGQPEALYDYEEFVK